MNEKRVIRALKLCSGAGDCENCPYYGRPECYDDVKRAALKIIIRQKEEIEKLKKSDPHQEHGNCVIVGDALVFTKTLEDYDRFLEDVAGESIKDFAESAKKIIVKKYNHYTPEDGDAFFRSGANMMLQIAKTTIDELLKRYERDENGTKEAQNGTKEAENGTKEAQNDR